MVPITGFLVKHEALRTEMTFLRHFPVPPMGLEGIPTSSRAAFIGSDLTGVLTALSSEDISEVIKYLHKGLLKPIKPSLFPVGLFEVCIPPKNESLCKTLLEDERLK